MRVDIDFVNYCTVGYRGWLIGFWSNPKGHFILTPTAGDSPMLSVVNGNITA